MKKLTVFVYIIAFAQATKIGISENPQSRLREIQTSNPHELRLVKTYASHDRAAAIWVEKLLHQRYEEFRLAGEWFNIHADIVIKDIEWALNLVAGIASEEIVIPQSRRNKKVKHLVSYKRVENASEEVERYLKAHPEHVNLPVRQLSKLIGVGKSTVSKIVKAQELKESEDATDKNAIE